MSTLGQRIRVLRKEKRLTQEELADNLNVARGTLANWEVDRTNPDPQTLQRLADFFGVSTDYLLCRTNDPHGTYVPPGTRPVGSMVRVPVLGIIRAGMPIYACEHVEKYEVVPAAEVDGAEYFFLRVSTDSMTGARIYPGDLALVRKQDCIKDGEIVVVIVDGENATLRRIYFQGDTLILQSETKNSTQKPILFQGEDRKNVHIIGKVVRVTFEPK